MITIRKAFPSDEEGLFSLLQQFPSRQLPGVKSLRTPDTIRIFRDVISDETLGTIFVADDNNNLIGVITMSYTYAIRLGGRYSSIEEFIVGNQARGKGVGSRLLQAVIDEAKKQDCYELHVANPSEMGYPVYVSKNIKEVGKHLKLKLRE